MPPDSSSAPDGYWYDDGAAQLVVDFFRQVLVHSKGEHAGRPFILEPWQERDIIRPLFGWKRKSDGTRRYREAYVEVPKKNGKSTLAAGIAIYLLFADGEPLAEVYSAAGDKDQARLVFDEAKRMRLKSPELRKRSRAYKDTIVVHQTASKYQVLSADAPTKHGLNCHGILFDELHVQASREMWDTLTTGVAARRQPLTLAFTTAGVDRHSICWEKHDYALKILEGSVVDPEFLAVVYRADEKDDWRAPETWRKANPNFGVSVQEAYLKGQVKKAEESLPYLNTFKRLHLNIWTESIVRAISPDHWQRCGGPTDLEKLAGRTCYGGLDLSTTTDTTALVLLFPPLALDDPRRIAGEAGADAFVALSHFWCPEEMIALRSRRDRVPYEAWAQQGYIKRTAGNVVDYDVVRQDVKDLTARYRIREIAFDRWNSSQLVTQLQEDGAVMVGFGQGFASMSAPTKELINKVIAGGQLRHGDQPVLAWMAANLVLAKDAADNWKPTKAKSSGRIDGMVALIMALGRHMAGGTPDEACGVSVL